MPQKVATRREKAKEETRRIILKSAYALFEEKGYQKATIRKIASRAGVGLGTISQHFSSKTELLIATLDEDMRAIVDDSLLTLPNTSLKEQLLHSVRQAFIFYANRPRLSRVLLKEITFIEGNAVENIKTLDREYWDKLKILFTDALSRGEICESTNIADAVKAFWAYYIFVLIDGLKESNFDIDGQLLLLGRLIDQLLDGIGK